MSNEKATKDELAKRAAACFEEVAEYASEHGLTLKCCNERHYQLIGPKGNDWLINLYPTTGSFNEAGRAHRPPLGIVIPNEWTLATITEAVIRSM